MTDILVSWIGNADITGAGNTPVTGPLASILRYRPFQAAYLLHNQKEQPIYDFIGSLSEEFDTDLIPEKAHISSPVHFADIYSSLDSLMARVVESHPGANLYIQLTSGTSVMASVSILAGKTKYPASFLQSSPEQGVELVDIPFDIAADFLPGIEGSLDQTLSQLIANQVPSTAAFDHIITQDLLMQRLKERAALLAARDVPVLIHGETGTGKELFARAIHNSSSRSNQSFLSLNCGAIPSELVDSTLFGHVKGAFTGAVTNKAGVFEEANGGTLFLDEFGDLPKDAQVRLLRVLQDGTYSPVGAVEERTADVRLIVATNKDLPKEIAAGRFREDLFYRVAIGVINLPPLRHRQGDRGLLAESLLDQINSEAQSQPGYKDKKLSAGAKNLILNHPWPGNVRELYATILRASLWGGGEQITELDLKEAMLTMPSKSDDILERDISQGVEIKEILGEVETRYIERALDFSQGKKQRAADLLGFKNYQTLSNRMKALGMKEV